MKSYVRYEPTKSFGVIASVQCNVTYDWSGNIALTGAGDSVSVWNVRQGTQISSLINENRSYPYTLAGEVNYIAYSPDRTTIAAGYSTGEICIFQYLKSSAKIVSSSYVLNSIPGQCHLNLLSLVHRDLCVVIRQESHAWLMTKKALY